MGLGIKKAFKGFKKVFKKIGKGIKKAFNKIGQWTGKLGILGQIGLSLILPGIGAAFTGMLTGSSSALLRAAGNFLAKAGEIGKAVGNSFSTVTEGVTKVVGQTIGTVADKLGFQSVGGFKIQNPGFDKVWDTVKETGSQLAEQGKDLFTNTTREMAVTQGLTESVSSQLTDTIDTRVAQDVSSQVGDTFNTQNLTKNASTQLTDTIDTSVAQDVSSKASLLAPSSKKSMGIFDKVNQSIVTGIQSGLQQKAFAAAGGKLPETNYTSYSTYVAPDMTMPIQTAEADNLYTSLATDSSMLSQVPWGFNAGVYGEFNAFKNNTSNTQRRSR
jgi:hypothetical protein